MSDRIDLEPGKSVLFTTRPAGQYTTLFVIPSPTDPGASLATFLWHIELCCQPDHVERGVTQVDISAAAGALVTVKNIQSSGTIQAWTDYI
jgi:hypothetical protein